MSSLTQIQTEVRRANRERRFEGATECRACGERELAALTKVSRQFLEDHHVVGIANDGDLTITLCLNCHRKVTEKMLEVGAPTADPRSCLDRTEAFLRGLAAFFAFLAEKLLEWADGLHRCITGLDRDCRTWRLVPEAV